MSFFSDIMEDPALMALLAGTAIVATGGLAAPAVAGAAGAAGVGTAAAGTAAGGLLASEGAAAAAPAVLGAEAAGGLLADPVAAYAATGGVEGSIMGSGLTGAGGSSGAVGSGTFANTMGNMKGMASAIKPYGEAIGAASKVQGLLAGPPGQQQPRAQSTAPQIGNGQGAQTLAQLYQQGQQISPEEQARLQRKTMWG